MKLAVHQPHYFPYLGYFQKMVKSDVFVLLDTVQYVKNEWMNRQKIVRVKNKIPSVDWMSLSVTLPNGHTTDIYDVELVNLKKVLSQHYEFLLESYKNTEGWDITYLDFHDFFVKTPDHVTKLSEINRLSIDICRQLLHIEVPMISSSDIESDGFILSEEPSQRLVDLCKGLKCDTYIAGIGSKNYMDFSLFEKEGIKVEIHEFEEKPYPQIHFPDSFVSHLSTLDLLFNVGPDSYRFL